MKFLQNQDEQPVRLKLQRDRNRAIKQGHPWIYKDWLLDAPGARPGSRALVRDKEGNLIAFGMYDPESPLAVRVCAVEQERLDEALIRERLEAALALRRSVRSEHTTGYRLINGEGDGLPGIHCDIYGRTAVIKLDGAGPEGFWNLDGFAQWLAQRAEIETVYLKHRSDGESRGKPIRGKTPKEPVRFLEHGLTFQADLVEGQKTGFFFDQRENRLRVKALAEGRTVLNLFAYTGGFSVYAGAGGAAAVTTVDLAKPAVAEAVENWKLNSLAPSRHEAIAADCFEYLTAARQEKRTWDLVIVDPPSFAPAERHVEKATESYAALFASALQVVSERGIIALSSCSSHIPQQLFNEICQNACSKARRRAQVIGIFGQPEDHPFPLVCSELQYLKFTLLALR